MTTTLFHAAKQLLEKWTLLGVYIFQPVDASSLAVNRILLGSLLLIDALQERGLSRAETLWADDRQLEHFQCRFPLFDGWLTRLDRPEAMCAVYTLLFGGIVGVTLGYRYRLSALVYTTAYWYLFLIEKSRWNNHSYLFGLLAAISLASDGHRKWSLDAVRWKRSKVKIEDDLLKTSVPFWQIAILRFQLFLVYFYAGVKKLDRDWLRGHSMVALSSHWIWAPFTRWLGLPAYFIDYYVIHLGGFAFDSMVGFLLLYGRTRPLAFALATFFNVANSQMFSIGMFPWVMLSVMPIFCRPDWPMIVAEVVSGRASEKEKEKEFVRINNKKSPTPVANNQQRVGQTSKNLVKFFGAEFRWFLLSNYFANSLNRTFPRRQAIQPVKAEPEQKKLASSDATLTPKASPSPEALSMRQHLTLLLLVLYSVLQLSLPFAHRLLLPGYSTWTHGPYGTGWDMMIHNWQHMHTRVTVMAVNQSDQQLVTLYLDPENWSLNGRWAHHADMAVQFGQCVTERLEKHFNLRATALYLDVWSSLNGRFSQRMYKPGVNLLSFKWSPFESPTDLVMPIFEQSEVWRGRLEEMDRSIEEYLKQSINISSSPFLLYIADAPDLPLETYIDQAAFSGDATLFVLSGRVQVELLDSSGQQQQFLVSNSREDDLMVISADKTVKLPLGSVATITVRGCQPAYYGLLYSPLLTKGKSDLRNKSLSSSLPKKEGMERPKESAWISSLRVLFIGGRFLLTEPGLLILKMGKLLVALFEEYLISRLAGLHFGCQCCWNWWSWWSW